MAKVTYTGPEGFGIMGLGELEPGKELEIEDEALVDSLAAHPWFDVSGAPKKSKKAAKPKEADDESS